MINKTVKIQADKERTLKFNYKALMTLEENFGIRMQEFDESKATLKNIMSMTYCGLLHESPELTLDEMDNIMDALLEQNGFEYLIEKVMQALMLAFGINETAVDTAKKKVPVRGKK